MRKEQTLLLSGSEISELLNIDDCISAVEQAFKLYAEGKTAPPGILGVHARDGGFHIKAGMMNFGAKNYFAAKVNANFPRNRKFGLPTIQGVIVLCDGDDGRLLALLDSIQITIIRTGAATAVAAKYLARENSKTATICGCGNQGRISLRALMKVRPLEKAFAYDIDRQQSEQFAVEMSDELGIEINAVEDLAKATLQSDICVTCTPSLKPILYHENIKPGTFIAAVGADSEDKQELDSLLLKESKIVVDVLEQAAAIGELHHAIKQGVISRTGICAELGEIITGRKTGRIDDDEIIIFDSTGMALQDVVAAVIVYENAVKEEKGKSLNLGK